MSSTSSRPRQAGFTIVELVTVLIVVGILGAIGVSRFFDKNVFDNRAYADRAKAIIRYAQKLAVAQNRLIIVRADGNSFAVCGVAACGSANIIPAPGGTNSGDSATKTYCTVGGTYNAGWLCEGRPSNVTVTSDTTRNEFGTNGYFYFNALGQPLNRDGTAMQSNMTLTFASGTNTTQFTLNAESGYVQSP